MESVREECVKTQEELLAAVNEARCTWGELWFDKIIVAAPGTTAFCIAQTLREEWADTEKLTVICQNTLKDLWEPVEADEILLAEKDRKKLNRYCSRLIIRLFLEAVVKALFYCVKGKNFGVVILRIPYKMRYCWRQLRLQVFVAPGICCSGCGI